jgi:hypothetical protein
MAKIRGEGVSGGVDLLDKADRATDSEASEKTEDLNLRDTDATTDALQAVLRCKVA